MSISRQFNLPSWRLSLVLSLALCLSLTLAAVQSVAAATLTASVDRARIARDETLVLSLRIDTRSATGQPDLSLLEPYFRILRRSKSTQLRAINGKAESSTQWDISLAPKIDGRILIPPFEFDGARSQALQVEVTPAEQTPSNPDADYFLELSSDSTEAYVGQQVKVSLRLFTAVQLAEVEVQPLTLDDADVVSLDQQQYQKSHNGRRFLVYELNFAVIPHNSGPLEIPGQRLVALKNAARSLFDSRLGQRVRLLSQPLSLDIKPRPHSVTGNQWLPAASLSIDQTLSQPGDGYRIGEPISRTLVLQAEGVEASRLPELVLDPQSSFKLYPEPSQLEQKAPSAGLYASRTESYALVPTRTGSLTLPAIQVHWWDTRTDQPRIATVAAQTINVLPSRLAQPSQPSISAAPSVVMPTSQPSTTALPPQPQQQNNNWLLYSNLAWALLCLLLAGFAIRSRVMTRQLKTRLAQQPDPNGHQSQSVHPDDADAFRALEAACRQGDWQSIHTALRLWRSAASPLPIDDAALNEQSQRLNAGLYSAHSTSGFDSAALLSAVRTYRQQRQGEESENDPLPPLYSK